MAAILLLFMLGLTIAALPIRSYFRGPGVLPWVGGVRGGGGFAPHLATSCASWGGLCKADGVAVLVLGASFGPMAHYVLRFLFIDLSHCVVRSNMSMQQFVHLRLQGLRVAVLRALN